MCGDPKYGRDGKFVALLDNLDYRKKIFCL